MGSSSKGGGGNNTKSLYYGTIAARLGVGPAHSIEWIIVNGVRSVTSPIVRPDGADYTDVNIPDHGTARFYWGTETQMPDPLLNSYAPEPAHRGMFYFVLYDFCFGPNGETNAPNFEVGWRRKPNQLIVTGTPAARDNNFTANAMAVVSEWLTSWHWAQLPSSAINQPSFQAVAEALELDIPSGGSRSVASIAPLINEQVSLSTALADISSITKAWLRYDQEGKIEAGRWPRTADLGTVCNLTPDDLVEEPTIDVADWETLPNSIALEFRDFSKHHKQNVVIKNNLAAVRSDPNQQLRRTTARRLMLNNIEQAAAVCADLLRDSSLPECTVQLEVRRSRAKNPDGSRLRPGDYFTFPVSILPDEGLSTRLFRCTRREFDTTGPVTILGELETNGAVQAAGVFDLPAGATTVTPPINLRRVIAVGPGQSDVPSVYGLAARPDDLSVGFQLAYGTSEAGDKIAIGSQGAFALPLHLYASLSDSASTVRVQLLPADSNGVRGDRDAHLLQNWQGGALEGRDDALVMFILAKDGSGVVTDYEIVSVSGPASIVSSGVYDVPIIRARRGSSAQAFSTGSFPDAWTNYEVWLIPSGALVAMTHLDFLSLFGSSTAAYFEWSAYNAVSGPYDPEAAYNEKQRRISATLPTREFELQANNTDAVPVDSYVAPSYDSFPFISWTLPTGSSGETDSAGDIAVEFNVTDRQGDLIALRVDTRRWNGSDWIDETVRLDAAFAPSGTDTRSFTWNFPGDASTYRTYQVTVIARDREGHQTISQRTIVRPPTGAASTPPPPTFEPVGDTGHSGSIEVTVTAVSPATHIHWKRTSVGTSSAPADGDYTVSGGTTFDVVVFGNGRVWARASDGSTHSPWVFADYYYIREGGGWIEP